MDLRPYKPDIDFDEIDFDSKDVTMFLGGVAVSISVVTVLIISGVIGTPDLVSGDSSFEPLPPNEAGQRTVDMLNQRVLHNTPNNVTSELVDVKQANPDLLPDYYEVEMMVKNPTSQQITTVYLKKDASLVFLNHPRYFDPEQYRNQEHQ
jgi:hypothetical protein